MLGLSLSKLLMVRLSSTGTDKNYPSRYPHGMVPLTG